MYRDGTNTYYVVENYSDLVYENDNTVTGRTLGAFVEDLYTSEVVNGNTVYTLKSDKKVDGKALIYIDDLLTVAEAKALFSANAGGAEVPATGVVADVILPSAMIVTLLAMITFVAVNNKKRKVIINK